MSPTLQALFVGLLIIFFRFVFQALGVPVSDEFLATLAAVILAWILGIPAGSATAQAINNYRSRAR
jgi:hypothetical protein